MRADRNPIAAALVLLTVALSARPALADPLVVLCAGDSITKQYAPVLQARRPDWTVIDAGVGGEPSDAGARRLPGLLAAYHPQVVVLAWGANDALQRATNPRYTAKYTARQLRAMRSIVRSRGARAIMALPVGTAPTDPSYDELINAHLLRYGNALAEIRDAIGGKPPLVDFSLDQTVMFGVPQLGIGVHPDDAGVEIIVRRVELAVERVLGLPLGP
jgi:lysophospholipase L1-like esterase